VRRLLSLSSLLAFRFDAKVVDGLVNGCGATVQVASVIFSRFQSGRVRTYFAWMLLGAAVLLALLVLR
jgi:NADH:ubiquinone oxidoreductase subunit 5 (subunit L)/multisubunit Na+/H+ antiporter MnhA subunit